MRDHVAIAKKAARTRARMKLARDPEAARKAKRIYDAKRRLQERINSAKRLIELAGYASREFQSAMRRR